MAPTRLAKVSTWGAGTFCHCEFANILYKRSLQNQMLCRSFPRSCSSYVEHPVSDCPSLSPSLPSLRRSRGKRSGWSIFSTDNGSKTWAGRWDAGTLVWSTRLVAPRSRQGHPPLDEADQTGIQNSWRMARIARTESDRALQLADAYCNPNGPLQVRTAGSLFRCLCSLHAVTMLGWPARLQSSSCQPGLQQCSSAACKVIQSPTCQADGAFLSEDNAVRS